MKKRLARASVIFAAVIFITFIGCAGQNIKPAPQPPEKIEQAEATGEGFMVGAFEMDITPSDNVWMAGFNPLRRSHGVHDPLKVNAVVIKAGDRKIAMVSADLIGLMKPDMDGYRRQLKDFSGDLVIVASTHTHSGPDTMGMWGGIDENYRRKISDAVIQSINKALASAVPAKMLVGTGTIPVGAIKNVRQTDMVDRRVEVMRFVSQSDGSVIATVVNFACHPETLWKNNHIIGSDFVNYLRESLQKSGSPVVIYFNGAEGAMVTPDIKRDHKYGEVHTFAEAARIAGIMLKGIQEAISACAPVNPKPVRWARTEFLVPIDNPLFKKANKLGLLKRDIYFPDMVLTETAALRIGDVMVVTMPGEARPDIGLKVKEAAGSPHPFFLGLANDELGYILPPEAYKDPLFTYEISMSPGQAASSKIVEEAVKVIQLVK